ncbi:MAG: hypothetical protein HQK96_16095 [Nitrospirae bacterium]|nr:hypothetical protein [Nitrospirota bacterium]
MLVYVAFRLINAIKVVVRGHEVKRAASIIVMLVFLLSCGTTVFAEYVNGHFNKKGSYVSGHNRKPRTGSYKGGSIRKGSGVSRVSRRRK